MRVMLIGGGGREHALAWKLAQSPLCDRLWCAPGNPGISALAECIPMEAGDLQSLADWAHRNKPDLVVVGPEVPLVLGLADHLRADGLAVFGPSAAAARIEGSKAYSKSLMSRVGIPTASHRRFNRWEEARAYLDSVEAAGGVSLAVKASGLAAGKGAIICETVAAARDAAHSLMVERALGAAGDEVVIEERLVGEEASLLAIANGVQRRYCLPAQDHKRVGEGETGLMTGGMGACCPAPVVTDAVQESMDANVIAPALRALTEDGARFTGCLYAGLIFTAGGPKVLEFNARFGDPEAQAILPLLGTDLLPLLHWAATGQEPAPPIRWSQRRAVCVVLCAPGYPQSSVTGSPIDGIERAASLPDVLVFHAATRLLGERLVTSGGRVLNVVGLGTTYRQAADRAYEAADRIEFEGAFCRRDIAWQALKWEEREQRAARP